MSTTARLFIRTVITFLALGLGLGGYILFRREVREVFPNPFLVPAHIHAVGVGFTVPGLPGRRGGSQEPGLPKGRFRRR